MVSRLYPKVNYGIYFDSEGLLLIQSLISQSPDIQKLFTFEGAFEKLFAIIRSENGVEGGLIVQECLTCVDGLLRMNVSNQTFFRETGLAGFIISLLFFPSNLPMHEPTPQEFALQFWDVQKKKNVSLVVGVLGMLVGSKGSNVSSYRLYLMQSPDNLVQETETNTFLRSLIELSLASNAPTSLKIQVGIVFLAQC